MAQKPLPSREPTIICIRLGVNRKYRPVQWNAHCLNIPNLPRNQGCPEVEQDRRTANEGYCKMNKTSGITKALRLEDLGMNINYDKDGLMVYGLVDGLLEFSQMGIWPPPEPTIDVSNFIRSFSNVMIPQRDIRVFDFVFSGLVLSFYEQAASGTMGYVGDWIKRLFFQDREAFCDRFPRTTFVCLGIGDYEMPSGNQMQELNPTVGQFLASREGVLTFETQYTIHRWETCFGERLVEIQTAKKKLDQQSLSREERNAKERSKVPYPHARLRFLKNGQY